MSFDILIWPAIISAILFMPFGAFLYSSKGLGDLWLDAIGKTKEEIEKEESNMGLLMGGTFVLAVATVFILDMLIASVGVSSITDLLLLVSVLYLLVFVIRLKNSLFDGNMKLFKVNLLGTLGEFIITFAVFSFFVR